MKTQLHTDDPTTTDGPDSGSPVDTHPRRRSAVLMIAVAIVALLVIAAAIALTGGDGAAPDTTPGETLELSLGEGAALASCLPVDAAIVADMSPAFAATATAVEGEDVTLTVERWYAGGDADTVVLHAPAGMEALIAGFDLEVGQRYLITATEGAVNYCGFSGPSRPSCRPSSTRRSVAPSEVSGDDRPRWRGSISDTRPGRPARGSWTSGASTATPPGTSRRA